jgi:hypothetical protein
MQERKITVQSHSSAHKKKNIKNVSLFSPAIPENEMYHDQLNSNPGMHVWFSIIKYIVIIQHNNIFKGSHFILSLDVENTFNKI